MWMVFSSRCGMVWVFFSSRLSLYGPFPGSLHGIFSTWKELKWSGDARFWGFCKSLLHCLVWSIWTGRNNRIFVDKERSTLTMALRIDLYD
ncbi:hypothetical protein LINGRAHAP2_LOCUS14913, partial [Linum grandiflorum]